MCNTTKSCAVLAATPTEAEALLVESGSLLNGHFLLSSGLHSNQYFQCATLLEDPKYAEQIARAVAEKCTALKPDVVLAPALGAVVFGYELARQLGVRSIFAERPDGKFELRRGFAIKPGERVLMAENVVTTGGSVVETAEMAKALGANIVGYALIVDRTMGRWQPAEPLIAYAALEAATYPPDTCPLCATTGTTATKPGSRT